MPINYISKVKATDGSTYMIKDSSVWGNTNPQTWINNHSTASLADVVDSLSNYSDFLGVTTSAISEGSTTSQIIIDGNTVTAQKGSIVLKDSKEFIWNGTSWAEFGDLSAITDQLGDLAYKDTAAAAYTPAGTVSQPTFNGTAATVTAKGTPAGTVSQPTFTGTAVTITAQGTPSGTVSKPDITVTAGTKAINYVTGRGTLPTLTVQTNSSDTQMLEFVFTQGALCSTASINATTSVTAALAANPTFTGASLSATVAYTPEGTVSQPTFSGASLSATAAYTPAGTITQPSFTGTASTITVS